MLSPNCTKNNARARVRRGEILVSQTRHAATAIIAYNRLQTGPKIHAGGLTDGLTSAGYQVSTLDNVITAPTPETAKQTAKKPARTSIFFNLRDMVNRESTSS